MRHRSEGEGYEYERWRPVPRAIERVVPEGMVGAPSDSAVLPLAVMEDCKAKRKNK
jgi:hypothetical protein